MRLKHFRLYCFAFFHPFSRSRFQFKPEWLVGGWCVTLSICIGRSEKFQSATQCTNELNTIRADLLHCDICGWFAINHRLPPLPRCRERAPASLWTFSNFSTAENVLISFFYDVGLFVWLHFVNCFFFLSSFRCYKRATICIFIWWKNIQTHRQIKSIDGVLCITI